MDTQSTFPDNKVVAIGTFRNLSEQARKHISVERIGYLLYLKDHYLTNLTYVQKCKVTDERVIEVTQNRLQRNGMYFTKSIISLVLQAEAQYYASQYANEESYDWAA